MTAPTDPALPAWRAAALTAYRIASMPWRRQLAAQQAARHQARVMVLFYHRVAEVANNPWTIPFATFRRQIDYLRKHYELVSFEESLHHVRWGSDTPTAHITFDDGYADNCTHALPYLIANGVPATYFVSSRNILEGRPLPHDVELGTPTPVNTPQQIVAMAKAGIEIGAHTRHHADLNKIDDEATLYDEIAGSKHDLEALTNRPVRYFAFPYGTAKQLTAPAIRMCQAAGFAGICSAVGGYNFPGGDSFHLQRFHGDPDLSRFYNWVTMDPRKLKPQLVLPELDELEAVEAPQVEVSCSS